jgi:hypothetical protein
MHHNQSWGNKEEEIDVSWVGEVEGREVGGERWWWWWCMGCVYGVPNADAREGGFRLFQTGDSSLSLLFLYLTYKRTNRLK